jgi:hypothetical protein
VESKTDWGAGLIFVQITVGSEKRTNRVERGGGGLRCQLIISRILSIRNIKPNICTRIGKHITRHGALPVYGSINLTKNVRHLKVPKCEIFDRSDFHYFYTIKPFWVDDFVVKILTYYFNFWGSKASFSF